MGHTIKTPLTLALIQECLSYDADTGNLHWLVQRGYRRRVGDVAGSIMKVTGYWQVGVYGNVCYAHRVAWALAYNLWPIRHAIDHINMIRTDNRLCNLRAATNGQNMQNRGAQKNSTTGVKGVHVHGQSGGYIASIGHSGNVEYLGYFRSIEEAKAVYDEAARRLHGQFYRKD